MERLLMLLKGQQDKREMQRMLNTKPMTPDTPHPSLSAPEQTLFFACHSTTELQALQVVLTYSGIMLNTSLKEKPFRGFMVNTKGKVNKVGIRKEQISGIHKLFK